MEEDESMEHRDYFGGRFVYSRDQENRIVAALVSGNVQLAVSYINKVLDVNFLERRLSPEMSRCLLYSLTGTLLRAEEEAGRFTAEQADDIREGQSGQNRCGSDLPLHMQQERPLEELSLEELRDWFMKMAERAGNPHSAEKKERNRHLCQEVHAYILKNYSDSNLNITQIGHYFRLSPNYLSKLFRMETGESLLKVIARTRVREAEKLLQEGVNVAEAGRRVGFVDVTTFIRTYKRYTGATPGQVRGENMNIEQNDQ